MQAVKFGISFTTSFLNQAGALVLVYADGSVQVNHGGVEMGQGLHAKIINVVVRELGVRRDQNSHDANQHEIKFQTRQPPPPVPVPISMVSPWRALASGSEA